MKSFTIGDLENLTGIKGHTIRIWERRYQLLQPQRSFTNIRSYSLQDVECLLNVALLNKYGFRISVICGLDSARLRQKIVELKSPEATQDKAIRDLLLSILRTDADHFEFILDSCCASLGSDFSILHIILPFLERIEVFRSRLHMQDHFMHLLRRKLHIGIDKEKTSMGKGKTCLLFLPEGMRCDMRLLCAAYLFTKTGFRVIYLGQNSSLEEVISIAAMRKPELVFTSLNRKTYRFDYEKFASALMEASPSTGLIIQTELVLLVPPGKTIVVQTLTPEQISRMGSLSTRAVS
jgi:MerR family transcriptional regulator, light-induced transcriptional regulator